MIRATRPGRRLADRGAFTLLEVVIVACVASVIFLILLRWLSTLAGVAGVVATSSVPVRYASYVDYRLANDLGAATVCDLVAGSQIRTLDARTLELYVNGRHEDGTRGVQMVRWSGSDGVLTRTTWDVSVASNCLPEAGTSASARVMATSVYTGARMPFFTAIVAGADAGECVTVTRPIEGTESVDNPDGIPASTPEGDGCFASNVRALIPFLSSGMDVTTSDSWTSTDTPTRLDRTYQLPSVTRSSA